MKNLEYFFDTDNKILLAYNQETEFFAKYVDTINEWEKCRISFMQFEHDYNYKSISKIQALKISKGKTAEKTFKNYLDMLKSNLNG